MPILMANWHQFDRFHGHQFVFAKNESLKWLLSSKQSDNIRHVEAQHEHIKVQAEESWKVLVRSFISQLNKFFTNEGR